MKNKRRIIGIVAAMVLALTGTLALVSYVRSAKDDAVAQEALVDVYVVDELIPKGAEATTIRSSVSVEQVPARLKQDGAITDLAQVGDDVAATDLQRGDQLLSARLAARDVVFEEVTDKVQVSALLEAERAVGGAIAKGDLVGVYLSFEPFEIDASGTQPDAADEGNGNEVAAAAQPTDTADAEAAAAAEDAEENDGPEKTPNVTRLEFQNVLVTNVQTVAAPVQPEDDGDGNGETAISQVTGTHYVVTLALSPEQSERFVFATEFGNVWLSLDPASVADDGTRVVTLGNVYRVVPR